MLERDASLKLANITRESFDPIPPNCKEVGPHSHALATWSLAWQPPTMHPPKLVKIHIWYVDQFIQFLLLLLCCCWSHKKLDPHNTWPGVGRRYGPDIVNIFWKLWLTLSFTICIYVLGVVPEHLTLGKGNAKNGHTAWVPTERSTMPNRPEGPKPNLGSN